MAPQKSSNADSLLKQSAISEDNGSEPNTMPLAVVGMACRFAGGVNSPEKLWDFVSKGKSAWSTIPETRFNMPTFHHDQPEKVGSVSGDI